MSLEAMETLSAVEERLKKRKADALAAAKQAAADAREQGERMLAEAQRKADEEIAELTRRTDEKAKADADRLAHEGAEGRETLRANAEAKEAEAIAFVVERIVNG